MALWAYFDEGGHPSDAYALAFSMGGCIATCEQWLALDSQWRSVLADANLTCFHMADLAHFRGQFEGWTEEQRRTMLNRLLDIMEQNEVRKVGWARRLEPGQPRPSLEDIYNEAYRTSILYAEHEAHGEEIHFIFSEHAEVSPWVYQHRHEAVRRAYAESRRLGAMAFGNPRDLPALQTADLLAYELRDHAGEPHRLRYPMRRLAASRSRFSLW